MMTLKKFDDAVTSLNCGVIIFTIKNIYFEEHLRAAASGYFSQLFMNQNFQHKPTAYIGSYQTSLIDLFCENRQQVKFIVFVIKLVFFVKYHGHRWFARSEVRLRISYLIAKVYYVIYEDLALLCGKFLGLDQHEINIDLTAKE